ncbi:patatin-like phospholipase family protein [Defluviitalea phaphyphila]|uniref:patatin-like phospholipase family protein n=1 Tax=Defluviitalea phaphyphila TaxID=1473580 RepID=UPI0007316C19|nr:patatin-like phospholipase family protein [Defluviitalea phaphyphila]
MKIGLALSGGGIRGMSHIGALKALIEEGIKPDLISGASSGAIIAGLYGCGYTPEEIEAIVKNNLNNIIDIDYFKIIFTILNFREIKTRGLSGIIKGEKIEKILQINTQFKNIKCTKIPIAISATRVQNGDSFYFVSDKSNLKDSKKIKFIDNIALSKAIRASISFPSLFKPKDIIYNGEKIFLMDGGIVDNMPIKVLKKMGADVVIGVNLGYNGRIKKDIDSFIEIGEQAISIMSYMLIKKEYYNKDSSIYVYNPHIWDIPLLELSAVDECIKKGYYAMKRNIPMIKYKFFM